MSRITVLLFSFLMTVAVAGNGTVRISGKAPGFAGSEIIFHLWHDQISFATREAFRFTVDENEEFSVEFHAEGPPLFVFSNAGRNFMYMYVEAGMEYRVVLPPNDPKAPHEEMNPYFEGVPTHIAVVNEDSTGLNSLVGHFDIMYDEFFGQLPGRLSEGYARHFTDSVSRVVEQHFENRSNPWFDDYRRYRMGLLRSISFEASARELTGDYFSGTPVLYDNPSYMELFNHIFDRYFLFFSRTVRGSRIFDDINRRQSLASLMETLTTDNILGDGRLLEMVILKGLHDSFFGSDFSRSGLLVVLDSLAAATSYPEHSLIASGIRDKVTRMMPGFPAPEFSLMDRSGSMKGLPDYKGYYIYLNFCTVSSYGCLTEYPLLNRLHADHGKYLKIVTVIIDNSYSAMINFLDRSNYGWEFLFYGSQPEILKDYDVRMFPSYYLIDRDGSNLIFPAPSPAEDFELYLLRIMRSRGDFIQ